MAGLDLNSGGIDDAIRDDQTTGAVATEDTEVAEIGNAAANIDSIRAVIACVVDPAIAEAIKRSASDEHAAANARNGQELVERDGPAVYGHNRALRTRASADIDTRRAGGICHGKDAARVKCERGNGRDGVWQSDRTGIAEGQTAIIRQNTARSDRGRSRILNRRRAVGGDIQNGCRGGGDWHNAG